MTLALAGAQYVAGGFDVNKITLAKNIVTCPIGGTGGLIFKSAFQEEKGTFMISSPNQFLLDFSFGKMSDSFGNQIKSFGISKFSSGIGTYFENVLLLGSKSSVNVVKSEVKKEIKKNEK